MTERQSEFNLQYAQCEHIGSLVGNVAQMIALIVNDDKAMRAASDFTFRPDTRLSV
jgi:hypothetical protein